MNELTTLKRDLALATLAERAVHYIGQHLADSTKRAYAKDYRDYSAWCETVKVEPIPARPEIIAIYIAMLTDSGLSISTIERALASISKAHEVKNTIFPRKHALVQQALKGAKRTVGVRPTQVDAVSIDNLKEMVRGLDTDIRGVRNRALLTLGFAGAFRRSEIVAIDMEDITKTDAGYIVLLRRSKTDQEGAGREVGIPYGGILDTCPVRSLNTWLDLRKMFDEDGTGPLICGVSPKGDIILPNHRLNARTVARTVATAAHSVGLTGHYAGHSLRAGLVTAAAKAGKPAHVIQNQTGHKSIDMIMRYIRREAIFEENAATGIGL
jgi:site-specific recombinase XerD